MVPPPRAPAYTPVPPRINTGSVSPRPSRAALSAKTCIAICPRSARSARRFGPWGCGGDHPDLLVTQGESTMYVECAVLFDDGSIRSSDAQAWVLDCINSAKNPDFMVDIAITTRGSQRPKRREITQPIETWLALLDYDSIRTAQAAQAQLPSKVFEFRDWRVRLSALPVLPDRRGNDFRANRNRPCDWSIRRNQCERHP